MKFVFTFEAANVPRGQYGFLGVHGSKDIHARLLHHGKELGVVLRPLHVPHVLPLKFHHAALSGVGAGAGIQLDKLQKPGHVDYREESGTREFIVESFNIGGTLSSLLHHLFRLSTYDELQLMSIL